MHIFMHPQLVVLVSSSDEIEKTPTRATLTYAQRSPALLRALHIPHTSFVPLARPVGRLDALDAHFHRIRDGLDIVEEPVVSWE